MYLRPDPAYMNNKLIADHNRAINDEEVLIQFKQIQRWFALLSDEAKLITLMGNEINCFSNSLYT